MCKPLLLGVGLLLMLGSCAQSNLSTEQLLGEALAQQLRDQYYPQHVLSYAQARDTLYSLIDRHNDSLRCIYTGYAHYVNLQADPSQYVYDEGRDTGMNCEHSWPQSKGTKTGQARSDMHHLFPTRIDVNQARGNLPYGEVYDYKATHWYFHTANLRSLPSATNLDDYSELGQGYFEPPEHQKGNVARALFYIYVMYHEQVDHSFFEEQANTLLSWHQLDPADEQERARSKAIARYQDGKENPFVINASLAARLLQ